MDLIDTHCHLYLKEFDEDRVEVVQRAENEGVKKLILPSIDKEHFRDLLKMEAEFPHLCLAMAGLHPCSVRENYKEELEFVAELLSLRTFAAVGEIGLDFYWDKGFEKQQYAAFHAQIDMALVTGIPIVIHSRASMQPTIDVVRAHQFGDLRGIFHCFSDSAEAARQIIDLGFYLGIGGVITFKNSKLPDILANIDLQHIVLETDAPYLTPAPFRGKRNESSYLTIIAEKLAEIKGIPVEEVSKITTANALKIFGG